MYNPDIVQDSILHIGEVVQVHGRTVVVEVDKQKNHPDLLYDGGVVRNISVDSYIEIRKGFLSLIGKVDGEEIKEEPQIRSQESDDQVVKIKRLLTVSLVGYIGSDNRFEGGTKELPLIGNEAFVVSAEKIRTIHRLVEEGELSITVAETAEGIDIPFPVDGLFNGHIAIFGNTGSGKSNTLASIYQALMDTLVCREKVPGAFVSKTRFLLLDFNGEYGESTISSRKHIYRLSTGHSAQDKIPLSDDDLLDEEIISMICEATEKTQKPFLSVTGTRFKKYISNANNRSLYFRGILKRQIKEILGRSDKDTVDKMLGHMLEILRPTYETEPDTDLLGDIVWYNKSYKMKDTNLYFDSNPDAIERTRIYKQVEEFEYSPETLDNFIAYAYSQLIDVVLKDSVQNEFIAPALRRLKRRSSAIGKVFRTASDLEDFWACCNFVSVDLHNVNLDMKKVVPLVICRKIYSEHKRQSAERSLHIIVDEAHQILSLESYREDKTFKDYRLETFEEIIKEGRKFGVFVTISSQRPYDVSPTIVSQAHNYFIHRLINHGDLESVEKAVSYIDRLTHQAIPTLPTGTCIFSGVASTRPLKVRIKELSDSQKPKSQTLTFANLLDGSS